MRIVVTGGAGFIGSNFVRKAMNKWSGTIESVTVLDSMTYAGVLSNLQNFAISENYRFIKGDIRNPKDVDDAIFGCDAVVNFAAESHVDRSINSAGNFVSTNTLGVQVLLDAILKSKSKIRFVQISTDEVYGSILRGSWTEESPLMPNSPYSASKAGGELLARAYYKTHGLDVVITRCSNNYGTHHFPEKLIPLFITNLMEGRKVPVYGSGANVRDWLHVDDHCEAIFKVLTHGRSGEVYNIGGGRELSNLEITRIILEKMGADESVIEFVEDRKGHDFRYSVNWSKIKNELGYEPKVTFEEGIQRTIEWYKTNESWWKPLKA